MATETTFAQVLSTLREQANNPREQGTLFEDLMETILPELYEYNFAEVWSWAQWPQRKALTGSDARDIGIDLVARIRDSQNYCAIQCKFVAPESTLQKSDIDSFFTESGKAPFASRLIITTTDKWSAHAEKALQGQQIPVSRMVFSELDNHELGIKWDLHTPQNTLVKPVKKQLRAHQEEALDKVTKGFVTQDRGKLVMACGTGKTLVSLYIAEQQVAHNGYVLVLVPSIALMSQTLKEWSRQRQRDHRYLAVCSDSQVAKSTKEEEDMPVDDLTYSAHHRQQ